MADFVQSLLGSTAIAVGGIAGLLAVLDWILSREIKNWFRDKASTLWIWLSYQRTWPYIRKLQSPRAFDIFISIGVALVLWICLAYVVKHSTNLIEASAFFVVLIPVAIIFFTRAQLRLCAGWLTRGHAGWRILVRGVLIFVAAFVMAAILVETYNRIYETFPSHPFTAFTAGILVAIVAVAILMLLYAMVLLAYYIVGVYLLVFLFKLSEFIVLRVAEYDKGPVLGLAALLTGVGTVLRALAK